MAEHVAKASLTDVRVEFLTWADHNMQLDRKRHSQRKKSLESSVMTLCKEIWLPRFS